jgi:hypothetical protein
MTKPNPKDAHIPTIASVCHTQIHKMRAPILQIRRILLRYVYFPFNPGFAGAEPS